jgi:DNA repair exonuclease SbcCD nuclease subunit
MERINQNKKPDLILTSDWHLREDTPISYKKDYWNDQLAFIDSISTLQKKYDCPVIHAGDLFDHWKPSPNLLRETILHLPDQFYTIYGQHDLPQHNLKLAYKCGIDVLREAKKLTILNECHYGQEPNKGSLFFPKVNKTILVWHKLAYFMEKPYPGATGGNAKELLKKYPWFDLIVTGDNHQTFITSENNRLLVNPGSLMRMDANQINHHPCVFLWYAEDNMVIPYYLPFDEDALSRDHIEKKKERDDRLYAFISKFTDETGWNITLSFEDNVETFMVTNNTDKEIQLIVNKAIEK